MTTAVERAGEDAHAPALLAQAQVVFVPRGTWRYRDPGRIVAERVGATARSVIAELGVLQSTPFTRACRAIASGDLDVAIVVGGEAKFRDLRGHITGTAPVDTVQDDDVASRREHQARRRDHPRSRACRRIHERAVDVLGVGDRAADVAWRDGGRERARDGRVVGRVQSHRGGQPRRVAARPGGAGVPRAPVGEEPDARGAVHEAALLAVERRPGRRVRAVLVGSRRSRRCARRTSGCTHWPSPSRTTCSRSRSARSSTARRPCASAPNASPTSPASTSPPATSSTCTAASPSRCASRRRSSASRSTIPTAGPSASAAA